MQEDILDKFRVRPAMVYKPVKFGKIEIINEIGKETSLNTLKEFHLKMKKNESTGTSHATKNDQRK